MRIAVLNFRTGNVYIHNNIPDMEDDFDIEDYLRDTLYYDTSDIQWMVVTGEVILKDNNSRHEVSV